MRETLGDDKAPRRVTAGQRDAVTPVRVNLVELDERREAPRRPEARLVMAHRALDGALLARRRRRAGGRVKRVVAAQLHETRVPGHHVVVALGDRRTQVVIDALARHPTQPRERPDVALQKRLGRHVEAEVRRRRPRERQRADQRVDPALAPGDLRARRHLGPIDLQHLPRAIASPLRRPCPARAQRRHPPAHQIDRPDVAVIVTEDLRHARGLDLAASSSIS